MEWIVETESGTLCKVIQNGRKWTLIHPQRGAGEIEGLMGRQCFSAQEIDSIMQFKGNRIHFDLEKQIITSKVVKIY